MLTWILKIGPFLHLIQCKQLTFLKYWVVSPIDGLVLMWHIPSKLSSVQPQSQSRLGTDLAECWLLTHHFLRPQRAISPGFYPIKEVYCLAPDARLIRGMPTRPLVFLENVGRVWAPVLRRNHLKKALCRACPFGGACNRYPQSQSRAVSASLSKSGNIPDC